MNVFSSAEVEGLQSQTISLGWIVHGRSNYNFGPEGPAVLGVSDCAYALTERLITSLEPGDVYAREAEGGLPTKPLAEEVSALHYLLSSSPYVEGDIVGELAAAQLSIQGLSSAEQNTPTAIEALPELRVALAGALREGRNLQVINPWRYGEGLAILRGVRRVVSDAHMMTFLNNSRGADHVGDVGMVQALANTAVQMREAGETGQTMVHIAGIAHKSGVQKILNRHSIAFSAQIARRSWGEILKSGFESVRAFAPLTRFALSAEDLTCAYINTVVELDRRRWEANLEKHGRM